LGAATGAVAGTLIGQQLDQRDRERAEAARQQALMSASTRPVTWTSSHNQGVRGSSVVTNVQRQSSGGQCRTIRETAYIRGQEVQESVRYCQNPGGQWVPQA
jgi:surface antigen